MRFSGADEGDGRKGRPRKREKKGEVVKMGINKTFLSGNLTRDAELKALSGKSSVLNFSIAVNNKKKNAQTGEWEEYAEFFDCAMFGARAEGIAPYLTKGTKVAAVGRLHQGRWVDKETGKNRSRVDIYIDEIEFMSSRKGGAAGAGGRQEAAPAAQGAPGEPPASAYAEEDLPF